MVEAHSQNIVEPPRSAKAIPTLEEFIAAASARMVELAPSQTANLDAEVDLVISQAGPCFEDVLTLLTYSRGCQVASFHRYCENDTGNGMLYQTLGQMCLDRALALIGEIISQSITDGYIVTH